MADSNADAFNAFEAAGWGQKAAGYDAFLGKLTSRVVDALLDAAGVGASAGVRVLDLATGPGYAASAAAERGADVVGVDVAEAMVELARRRAPEVEFRVGHAEALPFGDRSFDAVVGNFAVMHFGRPDRAVGECVRVLKPGGRLALTAWGEPKSARMVGVFLDAIAEVGATPPSATPAGPSFFQYSDDERFAALLQDSGLRDVEVRTIGFNHALTTADELWDGLLDGTVRTAALVQGQPDETRQRIHAAFSRLVDEYRRGDRIEIPVSVKLAAGRV